MIQVSIIVPCYNQSDYLDDCLESILFQTFKNWECIIVNDGSTDETSIHVEKWLEKDKRFKYFEIKNGGLSNARNFGISNSVGEFILPLDADDKISLNYVTTCFNVITGDRNIKIVYGQGIKFGEINEIWHLPKYNFRDLLNNNMIFCCALFYKKDWAAAGGYDCNLIHGFEDWELWINILQKEGKVIQDKTCFFYYRIKKQSMSVELNSSEDRVKKSREYIFHKHIKLYTNSCYDLYLTNLELTKKVTDFYETSSVRLLLKSLFKRVFTKFF